MKHSSTPKQLSFQSKLVRISTELEYYALAVPAKITQALGTRGPVAVSARVNNSKAFLVSLFPVGGGRHYIRIKAKVRDEAEIKGGDRVRVQITILDPDKVSVPKDLASALRKAKLLGHFNAISVGKKRYMIRLIDGAAKPETRAKRILNVVKETRRKSAHSSSN